ncbi:MAG TPA: hypothetical protein VMT55_02525, partial [Candidatus Sulfotelmatobacter sp.]|nr:hypothetical protein [Candidatus Sulfotelmatobacter sp.]
ARLLPPPARARLPITPPRYLAKLAGQPGATQRPTADAALRTLCGQLLTGELTAGRLWNLPGDLPFKVARELGLKPDRLWSQNAVNRQLQSLCRSSRDQWLLANLCLNDNLGIDLPLSLVAACNFHTPWESALGVLVRLPAEQPVEPCNDLKDLKSALRQLRNIHLHGGRYGTRSALLVGSVLQAHQSKKAAIYEGLQKDNYPLWHCRQVHREHMKNLFTASPSSL